MTMRRGMDVYISVALLLLCASAWPEVWSIRRPSYAQISPALWTAVTLAVFSLLSLWYFVRSVVSYWKGGGPEIMKLPAYWYLNPLLSVLCFFLFLVSIPYLGMLLGSFLFIFSVMLLTGPLRTRAIIFDVLLAAGFSVALFLLFTYAFGIIFPRGDLTGL